MSKSILSKWKQASLVLLSIFIISGCSWVQPLPGADDVALMPFDAVQKCQRLGETNTQTLDKVGLLNRSEESIQEELIALAKNEAVRMRGDTIVKMSDLKDGMMLFAIYNCY